MCLIIINVEQIIEKAKERYPAAFNFRGKLSPEERKEIENNGCDIRNSSVYMDGSCYYVIRKRENQRL